MSLKSSAFSVKSTISPSLCDRGGIQGIFLLFRRSSVLTGTTLDLLHCLLIYQIGINNYFAWIPRLQFLNVLEELEIQFKDTLTQI